MRFGRTSQTALSVISLLVERAPGPESRLSSADVAKVRRLSKPLVAKVLTILSTAGFVSGTRGPGGGYWMAKKPLDLSLYDVTLLFERPEELPLCPFGPHWCGKGDPCPMHDAFAKHDREWVDFLKQTTLDLFVERAKKPTK
jgi:Rrf2 family transcriptional regulator, iron-sulfur cluster assembly transcription factor